MKSKSPLKAAIGLATLLALPAHAAITYVDATEGPGGNTRASGFAQDNTDWVIPNQTASDDGHWVKRTIAGTNSTIFQAMPNGDPSAIPQLTTTIPGLNDGDTYTIWVFFQDNVGDTVGPIQNWVIAAGLTPTLTTTYWSDSQPLAGHNNATPTVGATGSGTISSSGVSEASTLTFSGTPPELVQGEVGGESERRLYGVNLGQVTLSGETSVDVYIDMLIEGNTGTTRTWYDGVGYELIPEPSTALLGGLGALCLLRRRR